LTQGVGQKEIQLMPAVVADILAQQTGADADFNRVVDFFIFQWLALLPTKALFFLLLPISWGKGFKDFRIPGFKSLFFM
jgi:hypothetical protein